MAENPIEYRDFIKPDNSIENLIAQLTEVDAFYDKLFAKLRKQAKELEASIKKTSAATDQGKASIEQAAEAAEKLAKEHDTLKKAQSENGKELAKQRLEQQKANNVTKLTAKLNEAAEGSYDKLSAQYSLNKLALNAMSKAERESTKAGKDLEAQSAKIYEEMKRLQEATGKHTLSVGDYEKGWRGFVSQMAATQGAGGKAAQGFEAASAGAKAFLANPLVLTISLIVAGLSALVTIFMRTEKGADAMAKATGVLNGVVSFAIGMVDKLANVLEGVLEDPIGSLQAFGRALVENILNRLKAAVNLVSIFGRGLQALYNKDLSALKDTAKDAAQALIQMQTGLDAEQQNAYAKAIAKTTEELEAQALAFKNLEASRRAVRKENRALQMSLESLITKQELLQAVADDATKSFKEREAAAKQADSVLIKRAEIEQKIAANNLASINKEIDLRQANGENVEDLLDQQLGAYSALMQAQRSYLLSVRDNEKRESELKQDRLERDLDIAIDGFANQKNINLKILADTEATEEQKRKKIEETRALGDESFAKQISTIEKFTGANIDANDLINESNAVALIQKIRALGVSEIIEGRVLEIIRDRKDLNQELSDAEKKIAADRKKEKEAELKQAKEDTAKKYDLALSGFDQEKELRESEIDILKASEAEKTKLRLTAEKVRLEKILALNKNVEQKLSDIQLATMRNTIAKIEEELAKTTEKPEANIYAAFGLSISEEQKKGIEQTVAVIKTAITDLLSARLAAIDKALDKVQEEKAAIQERYDSEIEAREMGLANNSIQAQRELELNRAKEAKIIQDKEKAQKAQAAIDTATQISSLITASTQIWSSLSGIPVIGPILAAAAVGALFVSFGASKVKAKTLAKQEYGKGGLEILRGGSHASGNDIPIGTTNDGKQRTAEGGEAMAIISKKNTSKYKSILPKIINSLNTGTFESHFGDKVNSGLLFTPSFVADNAQVESKLQTLIEQGNSSRYIDGKGRLVVQKNNLKITYV